MGIDPLKPAAFLDRDGVILRPVIRDRRPYPPESPAAAEILPDVPNALARLKSAGYAVIVVTNQPDVARGAQRREVVEAIHAKLAASLPIDEFRVCYHDDQDACACRKPKPGLLLQAPAYDLRRSVLVGDRWRDIEAGRNAGVRASILIDYHYDEIMRVEPDVRVASLTEAVDWILQLSMEGR